MTQSIGEKIKAMRKSLNMTQSELAGNEMTKGMLSHIENNQSFPSMKNLQYISQKLGKPISYFLDDDVKLQDNLPVEYINNVLKESNVLIEGRKPGEALPKLEKLSREYGLKDGTKIYGDYLYTLGKCLIFLYKYDEGEEKLQESIEIFLNNNLYIEASKAYVEFTTRLMGTFNYNEALRFVDKAEEVYKKSSSRNVVHEIEILYLKCYIHSAMGLDEDSIKDIDQAIGIARENNTYHLTDELYRMKSVIYLMQEKYEDFWNNINKAMQFAQFTENKDSIGRAALNLSIYYLRINDLENAEKYFKISGENMARIRFLYYIQEAKIYYMKGEYEKAYESIKKVDYSYYITHRFDYLNLWAARTYEGMILCKLGKTEEALKSVDESIKKLETLPMSVYLGFAYKNLSLIKYKSGDYKGAYEALNKTAGYSFPEGYLL
jgi:transcriptional regulator with XRE-family HTH domain